MTISHRLTSLNWVAVILSPLMVIIMEVLWVYPWLSWAGKWSALVWQRPPLSLASLILLVGISFFVTRFFLSRRWPLSWIRLSIIFCGLVAIFIVVRVEYGGSFGFLDESWFVHTAQVLLDSFVHPHPLMIALAMGPYLWWRGISWGRSLFYFEDIYRSFSIGLIALIALIIVWGAGWGVGFLEDLMSTMGLYVAGFFLFGLSALALVNLRAIQEQMKERREAALVFSRRWFSTIVGVIGGIVLVGISVVSLYSPHFATFLGRLLNLAADLLSKILDYLFIPIGYLVAGLFYVAQFIMNLFPRRQLSQPFWSENSSGMAELPQGIPRALSSEAILIMKWGFFALIVIGMLFLLARAVSRHRSYRLRDEIEEIHESLWSWSGFMTDLGLFFRQLRQRFRREIKKVAPQGSVLRRYRYDDVGGRLGIREIYRLLLGQASRLGVVRQYHETPNEYARRLGQAVPEGSVPLSELTYLYNTVRYGDLEAEAKQVDYANNLWAVLRRLLGKVE